jgi:hypothetical protein
MPAGVFGGMAVEAGVGADIPRRHLGSWGLRIPLEVQEGRESDRFAGRGGRGLRDGVRAIPGEREEQGPKEGQESEERADVPRSHGRARRKEAEKKGRSEPGPTAP